MRDFKIDAFNEENLKQIFRKIKQIEDPKKTEDDSYNDTEEELKRKCLNNKNKSKVFFENNFNLVYEAIKSEWEHLDILFQFPSKNHEESYASSWSSHKYITSCWLLCTKTEKEILETHHESDIYYESIEGNGIQNYVFQRINKDENTYIRTRVEKDFRRLSEMWFTILGYSWIKFFSDKNNPVFILKSYTFIVKNSSKEVLNWKIKKYLEKKYKEIKKTPTLEKWKQLIFKVIKESSTEDETKNLPVHNEDNIKGFHILILLLHLEEEIYIKEYWESYIVDLLKNIESDWLYFNSSSWEVYNNWKKLWGISLNTKECKLFSYLYNDKWVFKTHIEIKEEWLWTSHISWTDWQYLAAIKKKLPQNIKDLIEAPSWWYIIKE